MGRVTGHLYRIVGSTVDGSAEYLRIRHRHYIETEAGLHGLILGTTLIPALWKCSIIPLKFGYRFLFMVKTHRFPVLASTV